MSSRFSSGMSRFAAVAALASVSVVGLAGVASAHVTVNPGTAEQGGFTKVAFRVPNERDDAGTTKVQVDLPVDHPIAFVSVRPVPGWSVKVEKSRLKTPINVHGANLTEAVSRITWSGGKIDKGQFQEFDVSMGPLPTDVDQLAFKAEQTYEGGEVVRWDQPAEPGKEEPEHPAPVLKLAAKGSTEPARGLAAAARPVAASSADDGTARMLGGIGIAIGVLGLIVGAFGLVRGRRA